MEVMLERRKLSKRMTPVAFNRLGICTGMENATEGLTVLRSGAPCVDSLLQQDLARKGDCDLQGNHAGRPP